MRDKGDSSAHSILLKIDNIQTGEGKSLTKLRNTLFPRIYISTLSQKFLALFLSQSPEIELS